MEGRPVNITVMDTKTITGGTIEVVDYGDLAGSSDARTAEQLFFLREARMRLKAIIQRVSHRETIRFNRC